MRSKIGKIKLLATVESIQQAIAPVSINAEYGDEGRSGIVFEINIETDLGMQSWSTVKRCIESNEPRPSGNPHSTAGIIDWVSRMGRLYTMEA